MPTDPHLALHHALALHQRGDLPAAIAGYQALVAAEPGHAVAWHNLGTALQATGDPAAAEAAFRQCLGADPDHAGALWQLGRLLLDRGATADAQALFARLLTLDPPFAGMYGRLARGWSAEGRLSLAETAFRQLASAQPTAAEPAFRLGTVLQAQDRLDEADAQYALAGRLADRRGLAMVRALMLPAIPASEAAVDAARDRLMARLRALSASGWRVADPWVEVDTTPFHLAYHGRDDRPVMALLAQVYRQACPALAEIAPHCRRPRQAGPRLKVGFVSRFFAPHVVSAFFLDLVARLPADRIEAVAIQVDDPHAPAPALPDAPVPVVPLRASSLAGLRQQVAEAAFDVLVYPDIGMEPITYFLAHARLAPVQVVLGGHPVTTGLPSIDYFLSSADGEPDDAVGHYTERLLRLPCPPVWIRRPERPPAHAFAHPTDERWYVCPQSLFKLQPAMDEAFAAILRQDAHGRLILIEGSDEGQSGRWLDRFARTHGEVARRVRFLPRLSYAAYRQLMLSADALLDPFPFNGGHSTYTAAALGVPPVTLTGRYLRSRVTTGTLQRLGVGETITADVTAYVAAALRLGQDGEHRRSIGDRLRSEAGALFETGRAVTMVADVLVAAAAAAARGERLTEADLAGLWR